MLTIVLVIVVTGVLLWAAVTYIPMAQPIPKILVGVVVFALVLFLLHAFGVLDSVRAVKTPRVQADVTELGSVA